MDKETLKFIDKVFKDLYKSPEVLKHSSGNATEKFKNLEEYMDKLESVHEKAAKSEERIKTIKRMYHNKYVIKRENIPDSYFELQKRIALERGFGHVNISEHERELLENEVINNQKSSLDTWIDYFISDDAKFYPFWAKYWAFQGMLKMGMFDKEKGTFSRRTNETTAPFIDLNREALAMSIDLVKKTINKQTIDDRDLEIIIKSGSFPKIYQYILTKTLANNENVVKRDQGIWVKYNQGSDHMPLVKSLQGYNTGWCTAGEATAKNQLSTGDFYVYYTLDDNDEYKVPRIAIRMEYDSIGEIRGIGKDQNIEPNMEKVVEEKIKDFPDKDRYYKKVSDMKKLTAIYEKQKEKQELTAEELRFLYEIDNEIKGFGYKKDPRIGEIIIERNIRSDFSKIFNCNEQQISLKGEEISRDTIFYQGDLNLSGLTTAKGLILPKFMGGNLDLNGLTTAEGLILPENIMGRLRLGGLKNVKGLTLPKIVRESLNLHGLETAEGLILPNKLDGYVNLSGLLTAKGLILPETVGGDLDLSGLETTEGLVLPKVVGGDLNLCGLKNAKGLILPEIVREYLNLSGLKTAEGLILPNTLDGYIDLSGLFTAEGLEIPNSMGGYFVLSGLETAEGLKLPKNLNGSLDLSGLTTTYGLKLPDKVDGDLDLSTLEKAKGLNLPKVVGGCLDLSGLETAEDLKLPEKIEGNLYLDGLETAEGLILPESIGKTLGLNGLKTVDGLRLPKTIGGNLELNGLKAIRGLFISEPNLPVLINNLASDGFIFPEKIGGDLVINSCYISQEDIDKYRNNISSNNKKKRKIG